MPEGERSGALNAYKELNYKSRNIALGVAVIGTVVAPELVVPALLWAGSDQIQNTVINSWQKRKNK